MAKLKITFSAQKMMSFYDFKCLAASCSVNISQQVVKEFGDMAFIILDTQKEFSVVQNDRFHYESASAFSSVVHKAEISIIFIDGTLFIRGIFFLNYFLCTTFSITDLQVTICSLATYLQPFDETMFFITKLAYILL